MSVSDHDEQVIRQSEQKRERYVLRTRVLPELTKAAGHLARASDPRAERLLEIRDELTNIVSDLKAAQEGV